MKPVLWGLCLVGILVGIAYVLPRPRVRVPVLLNNGRQVYIENLRQGARSPGWFSCTFLSSGPEPQAPYLTSLIDSHGCELLSSSKGWDTNDILGRGTTPQEWYRVPPRRDPQLRLRLYRRGSSPQGWWQWGGEALIPNPCYQELPRWEAAPLPVICIVRGLSVTVRDFRTGVPATSEFRSLKGPLARTHTRLEYEVRRLEAGKPVMRSGRAPLEEWQVVGVVLRDAAGIDTEYGIGGHPPGKLEFEEVLCSRETYRVGLHLSRHYSRTAVPDRVQRFPLVPLSPNVPAAQQFPLSGGGTVHLDTGAQAAPGDLYVTVRLSPDPRPVEYRARLLNEHGKLIVEQPLNGYRHQLTGYRESFAIPARTAGLILELRCFATRRVDFALRPQRPLDGDRPSRAPLE